MRKPLIASLSVSVLCCCLFPACQVDSNDDCGGSTSSDFRSETMAAVPHSDGQSIAYEASDGSTFTVDFRGGFDEPSIGNGCSEPLRLDFSGGDAEYRLQGTLIAEPNGRDLPTIAIEDLSANGGDEVSLGIGLLGTGKLTAACDATARVLPELTRGGIRYEDVLERTYSQRDTGQIERVYYNVNLGLLGVDLVGGTSIWQLE